MIIRTCVSISLRGRETFTLHLTVARFIEVLYCVLQAPNLCPVCSHLLELATVEITRSMQRAVLVVGVGKSDTRPR